MQPNKPEQLNTINTTGNTDIVASYNTRSKNEVATLYSTDPGHLNSYGSGNYMVHTCVWRQYVKYIWPPWFSARVPHLSAARHFRCTYSPATLLCIIYRPGRATDKSLHHRWMVFPVSSSIHVECSAPFCAFFHISVPAQKSSTDSRKNYSSVHTQQPYWICIGVTVTYYFCSVIMKSLDLCHINDYSNTN